MLPLNGRFSERSGQAVIAPAFREASGLVLGDETGYPDLLFPQSLDEN
jgi:hypothetical protein